MKRLLFVLFTHIVATQALFAQLEIETTVPTGFDEAINVGVGTGNFETIVKNKSGVETITGIKVTPLGGLDGLEILVNATYEYNGTVYSASVTGDLIQTNGSVRLMAGEQIKFLYEKRAKCSIVPQASSGYSMQVVDDISVLGTDYSEQTNSYPILFPGLSVVVPESPLNNKNVEFGETFSDYFTIRNEQNAGVVQFLTLTIVWAIPQALEIDSIKINEKSFNIGSVTDSSVVLQLDSSGLSSLGFTDGVFRSGAELQVELYGVVKEYFPNMQVRYKVDYFSQDIECSGLENSEGVMYFRQEYPTPEVTVNIQTTQLANWCGTQYIGEITIENQSTRSGNNVLLDSYLTFNESYLRIDRVVCEGQELSRTSDGRYYLPTGKDKNRNGISSDLIPRQSLRMQVYATAEKPTTMSYVSFVVNLKGQNIVGEIVTRAAILHDGVNNVAMQIDGPGTIDEKTYPTGKYTLSYKAKRYVNSSFIDYDLYITTPTSSERLNYQGDGTYEDVLEETIVACLSDDVYFLMEAKTAGCPQSVQIQKEVADVVQRCYEGGQGCYNIIVDTAYLDKKTVGTCESVEVNAQARLDYHCNDSCISPTGIIVEIFDHSRQLSDFTISSIVINNTIAEVYDTTQEYSNLYRCNYSANCPEGMDTIIKNNVHITAIVEMPHNHLSKNRIEANLQVGIGIEVGENSLMSLYSWGERLAVYDSKPTFESYVSVGGCGDIEVEVDMEESDYAGLSGIRIEEVEFPGFANMYYSEKGINTIQEGNTIQDQIYVNQGDCAYISREVYAQCATNSMRTDQDSKIVVSYIDFADKAECAERKQVELSTANHRYYSPIIQLYPTEKQQSIEQTTTWTVRVVNEGYTKAENVMLKFTINPENLMDLYVENIYVAGKIVGYEQDEEGSFFVNIGSLSINQITDVQIEVSYRNCQANGTSTISVESAWSCEELTESNFDDFNCGATAELELENMVAVLNVVETYPKEYFHLCEDIPIHLNISNIGRADLKQMGFWFEKIPNTYTLTNNSILWNHNGENGTIDQGMQLSILGNVDLFQENKYLSIIALKKENNGMYVEKDSLNPLTSTSDIDIDFNVQMHCSSNQYQVDTLKFIVQSYTNCGDKQKKLLQFIPKLKGFDFLDSISVVSSTTGFTEYKGEADVLVSITNTSDVLIDSAYISVLLPKGFQYVDYTTLDDSLITGISQIPQIDGTLLLQWELQQGRHLSAHETVDIQFRIRAIDDCANEATLLAMCTLKRQMADCDGNICKVAQSTEAKRVLLQPVKKDLTPILTGLDSVCVGTPISYSVEGAGIRNVSWSFSDESILTDSVYGNTVRVIFPQGKTTILTATVEGECENSTLSKTIAVADVPDILLPDTVDIKWKSLSTVLDSLYAVAQWINAPLTIEGCGEYYETVQKENQCGLSSKNIVLQVTDCCDTVRVGDIVETEMQGITTYDVSMLMYYLKHKDALKISQGGIYQMQLRDDDVCDVKTVPLKECFEKRADMNGDGKIDEIDLELLLNQID